MGGAVEDFAVVELIGKWSDNYLYFAHCSAGMLYSEGCVQYT